MSTLTITASFPLGVFLGHGADGVSDVHYPSTKRLHGALMHAAGKGSSAVPRDGDLRPSLGALAALEWLESHEPDAIQHPQHCAAPLGSEVVAYRAEGTFDAKPGQAWRDKKARKRIAAGEAVAGVFGWEWHGVPTSVHDAVAELCEDVACLGENDSPVVLSTAVPLSDPLPLVVGAGQFSGRGIAVRTPGPGHGRKLEEAYEVANPRKRPTAAADRVSGGQKPTPSPTPDGVVRTTYYEAPRASSSSTTSAPWSRVILLPVQNRVPQAARVAWCVAFHRMLAQRLGDDAPPVITGNYAKGVFPPANRLAIHLLDQSVLGMTSEVHRHVQTPSVFAVLMPNDISADDAAVLWDALGDRMRVYRREGVLETAGRTVVSGETFWTAAGANIVRTWVAVPALVAETRRQPSDERGSWTLADAALLSLGFVFRARIGATRRGARGYRDITEWVRKQGAEVLETHIIADSDVRSYAHKLPAGLVTQAYRARLNLGSLAPDTAILAAGQSRHVGGGLLVPVDLPTDIDGAWPA